MVTAKFSLSKLVGPSRSPAGESPIFNKAVTDGPDFRIRENRRTSPAVNFARKVEFIC
jgi:hypothetical protein